ncbi:hypothetical protein [Aquimixticola soesokkakensis]|uniref:hypothetical protein n=1 Tax=Aquimixticola soesokkakensis TaxID=1519096 RepID=UPI000A26E2B7|nr:hypothetical protein [Aquimixticola soesokkakensis]
MITFVFSLILGALCLGITGAARAQEPWVAPEFLAQSRPDFGTRLPLCVLKGSPSFERDVQTAQALADVLLLTSQVVELDLRDVAHQSQDGVWPEIRQALAGRCLGVMGARLYGAQRLPDWLIASRPYFSAPYVLVSQAAQSLDDLAASHPRAQLGAPLYTPIDLSLITLIEAGGRFGGFQRRPFDRPEIARALMLAGAMDAAILWEPDLAGLAPDFYQTVAPMPPSFDANRDVAILFRSTDGALRANIDAALKVLAAEE